MNENNFEVIGNNELLKDVKVNCTFTIYKNENITYETKTLLYNGESIVIPYDESYSFYEFHISYKDNFVESFRMENIFRNAYDQINHLYLERNKNDEILFWFVGRKADVGSNDVYKKILIPKDIYMKKNLIITKEDLKKYNNRFYSRY
ncbi:hypothetical protein [Chryseobacterium echinoideorum]|uniref:hypothetical protein n=1 Tax=Chryseobacterium echinoideorum TaxID=1549648 RepID=UPI0011869C39|nr:hypothetical protein [Chryseobacterium echinoideorum]